MDKEWPQKSGIPDEEERRWQTVNNNKQSTQNQTRWEFDSTHRRAQENLKLNQLTQNTRIENDDYTISTQSAGYDGSNWDGSGTHRNHLELERGVATVSDHDWGLNKLKPIKLSEQLTAQEPKVTSG